MVADVGTRMAQIVPIRSSFDYELQLIREAIAMVASGKSPRVVLAGIRYGEILLDAARQLALDAGVLLTLLERDDHAGADISVEQHGE